MKTGVTDFVRNQLMSSQIAKIGRSDYGMIDLSTGTWVVKPLVNVSGRYQFGFDGEKFVNIEDCFDASVSLVITGRKGYVSVSRC